MKTLKVMDASGDTRIQFEEGTSAEAEAKKLFKSLISKGSAVFAVNRGDGVPDKRVKDFAELESDNVVVPRIAGG